MKTCDTCEELKPAWEFVDDTGNDSIRCSNCQWHRKHTVVLINPPGVRLPDGWSVELSPTEQREHRRRKAAEREAEEAEWASKAGPVKVLRMEDLPADSKLRD